MSGELGSSETDWAPAGVDVAKPSIARVYDYLLGGKDHFAADRAIGDRIRDALPEVLAGVTEQRAVLRRAVRYLVAEAGIDQLVDVGSGLPTAGNVHEVARAAGEATTVVYVDNDPVVIAHGRALLRTDPSGTTAVVPGDIRRPEEILAAAAEQGIDFGRPVGLLLSGILHYVSDEEDPWGLVARFRDALPAESHIFIQHLVSSDHPAAAPVEQSMREGLGRGTFRTFGTVAAMLAGLDVVAPGLVYVPCWRPDPDTPSIEMNPDLRLAVAVLARTRVLRRS